jgi:Uma2 family endonuclease
MTLFGDLMAQPVGMIQRGEAWMALPLENQVEYPTSDGQPMAETTLHSKVMSDTIGALERRYADVADVWVGGNLFMYYREEEEEKSKAPDVLFARGVAKRHREIYLVWEEKPPTLIFEITSKWTRSEDTGGKKSLYERLGVAELVLFDPLGDYLKPRLQGFRHERGRYRPIPPNRDGSLDLRTTGVTVHPEGERLRLVDTATGEKLLWEEELEAARRLESVARRAAEEQAAREAAGRRAAEERAAHEAAGRRNAEERAAEEAAARRMAEERAAEEASARRAAEEHARSLAEELARLRRESQR